MKRRCFVLSWLSAAQLMLTPVSFLSQASNYSELPLLLLLLSLPLHRFSPLPLLPSCPPACRFLPLPTLTLSSGW